MIFNIQKFSVHDGPGIRTTVFMKGCPLHCRWCANAESMNPNPELGVIRSRCTKCGKCIEVCPEEAIFFDAYDVIQFNRNKCTACGECIAVCPTDTLTIYGKQVTFEYVFKEVIKDKVFYEGSSGGVTVSGGEPLLQADFVVSLFQKCHEQGIHTCLDTCGYADPEDLKEVLAFTDYVLYDIKHMDTDTHRQLTGVANDLILDNVRIVAKKGIPIIYRIPLIKNVNDTMNNITNTIRLLKSLNNYAIVELLPYHRLGVGKYQILDKPYPGVEYQTPTEMELEKIKKVFEDNSITCSIGG